MQTAKPLTSLKALAKCTLEPLPADVFGIYFSELKRIAHCGLVESKKGNWITTIEGNTNISGSREGDGVHRKLRHQRTSNILQIGLSRKGLGNEKDGAIRIGFIM